MHTKSHRCTQKQVLLDVISLGFSVLQFITVVMHGGESQGYEKKPIIKKKAAFFALAAAMTLF